MATLHPMSPRGVFVPSTPTGGAMRAFSSLMPSRTMAFTAGLPTRDNAAPEAPPPVVEKPELPNDPPPAPGDEGAPSAGAARHVSLAEQVQAEAIAKAVQGAEAMAAEHAELERVREAEHAHLVADLQAQKTRAAASTERLGQLAAELARLKQSMVAELRAHAGTLLLLGARKLAGEALQAQPGLLEALVRETVETLSSGGVTVRVNPADVERVQAAMGEGIRVLADGSVQAGCIAEGDAGIVDATLNTASGSLLAEVQAWKRSA